MMSRVASGFALVLSGFVLLGWPLDSVGVAAPGDVRTVVVLYPEYADGRPANELTDQSLRAAFAAGAPGPIQIRNEYLDLSRFQDAGGRRTLAEFLKTKYADEKIDLVMAALAPSLAFALEYRHEIFPGVPIVFLAVDQQEVQKQTLPADVIGVPVKLDLAATLEVALRLHPKTRRVFVITGSAAFDTYWEGVARRTFRPNEGKMAFEYLSGLSMDDLLKRVANLPDGSVVIYLPVSRDATGKVFMPANVLKLVAAAANAPIYGYADSYVGRGIVGGHVLSFEMEAKHAADLALRILAGERPERISVPAVSPNVAMFDWRQLRRWRISEASLPPGSDIRFREPSLWDLYHWHIIGAICLFVLQTGLIVALLAHRASRRRADKQYWHVIETAPNGMLMVGADGLITMANAQAEKLFGYPREELVGRPVEMLVPERYRTQHSAHRERFSASPEVRLMGVGRELFGRRKDGSEFPVEIALSPAQPSTRPLVLATIADISLRKQAEEGLRQSQTELRILTGRLLQARESESRRIARELHDDLGQGLALLTVKMDLLRQQPAEAAGQLGAQIQELLAQLRHLSSSVHDLSHQLHPSKLEQLGLVAAIGGLCKELTHNHGLKIEFTHDQMPAAISPDTAVCLYRIAQEGLRNAIKHSGAQQAEVVLSRTADAISLWIVDHGRGFDPRQVQGKSGLGLVSMRERVRYLGGEIAIDSQLSGGTRLHVRVPLKDTEQPPAK